MCFLVRYKFALSFAAVLICGNAMVLRQIQVNQTRHAEVREALILLYNRGFKEESQRLYNRLVRDLQEFSNRELLEDLQRTLMLVDPTTQHPDNPIWKYHWVVSKELAHRE